ncbi:MAG: DUF4349 domain-containing protein [Oscillospiraceae bacterium]|nr:DUF4349 domain-containing protein [Oscillospiraceae bacterium]
MKKLALVTAILMLTVLAACSAGGDNTYSPAGAAPQVTQSIRNDAPYESDMMYDVNAEESREMYMSVAPAEAGLSGGTGDGGQVYPDISQTDPFRKLIRTANLNIETQEFDQSVANLEALCASVQGYIENSSVFGASMTIRGKQYRSASYTFRVPQGFYDSFLNSMGQIGNVVSKSLNSQDVTDNYYDIESRLKVLELRRDRLYGLLESETSSRSIIEFETSLSETLYEIDRMTGSLRHYDSLVDYSAVYVYLMEVEELTELNSFTPAPNTPGERISSAFGDSLEKIGKFFVNLFVFVAGNIIYILLWLAIIAIIFIAARKAIARRKKSKPENNNEGGAPQ